MTVYPTGTCFDDACELLDMICRASPEAVEKDWRLCHGVLTIPNGLGHDLPDGEPYAHAWVECDGLVFFAGALHGEKLWITDTVEQYYALHRCTDVTKYTLRELCELNTKHGTTGPWEPKYLALCKRKEPTHA